MTDLPAPTPIREYEGVDRARFVEEIRPAGQPAVLRGHARDWPAVQAALRSDEEIIAYLKHFRVERPVGAIVGQSEIGGRFFYTDDLLHLNFERGTTLLDPFLDKLLRDRDAPTPLAMAVQSEKIPEVLPGFELENDTGLLPPTVAPRAWIGNRIRVAPHYDLMENVGVVVAGRRRFIVFPPEQLANLYPGPFELTPAGTPISLVDIAHPDLARFPLYAEAAKTAQTATLEPGDAIYLPFHWWHAVASLEAVNAFVNYWWNPAPKELGSAYDALMFGLMSLRGLPEDQREVWRMLFDHYVFQTNGDPGAHLPVNVKGVLGPITPTLVGRMRATMVEALSRWKN